MEKGAVEVEKVGEMSREHGPNPDKVHILHSKCVAKISNRASDKTNSDRTFAEKNRCSNEKYHGEP